MTLEAIYNTVCTKCNGKGHLASECFNVGGTTYELIAADEDEVLLDHVTQRGDRDIVRGNGIGRGRRQSTAPPSPPHVAMGRGRGATLPSWMTQDGNAKRGEIGKEGEERGRDRKRKRRDGESEDSGDNSRSHKKKKDKDDHKKKDKKHKHHKSKSDHKEKKSHKDKKKDDHHKKSSLKHKKHHHHRHHREKADKDEDRRRGRSRSRSTSFGELS